jgi:hypothetical protein
MSWSMPACVGGVACTCVPCNNGATSGAVDFRQELVHACIRWECFMSVSYRRCYFNLEPGGTGMWTNDSSSAPQNNPEQGALESG